MAKTHIGTVIFDSHQGERLPKNLTSLLFVGSYCNSRFWTVTGTSPSTRTNQALVDLYVKFRSQIAAQSLTHTD